VTATPGSTSGAGGAALARTLTKRAKTNNVSADFRMFLMFSPIKIENAVFANSAHRQTESQHRLQSALPLEMEVVRN